MTKKKETNWRIVCTAIVCLAGLEVVALLKGVNGTLFTIIVAAIAAAAGLTVQTPNILKK